MQFCEENYKMLLRGTVFLFVASLLHRSALSAAIDEPTVPNSSVPNVSVPNSSLTPGSGPISEDKDESLQTNRVVTSNDLKQLMWRKCANKGYMTCVKLAVVQMVDRLDQTKDSNYQILPGITIIHSSDANETATQDVLTRNSDSITRNNISEVLDQYLMGKVATYLENLSLNVKILDDGVVSDIKTMSSNAVDQPASGDIATGRAKSKKGGSKEHFMMAALASGATLIALAFKTIALLAGKALITSLISLAIAAASAFKGHHHSEPKSTTYEIVTKPIVTHTDAHHGSAGGHASHDGLEQGYATYKRSIDVKPAESAPVDKVVYRITTSGGEKTPVYIPIEAAAKR